MADSRSTAAKITKELKQLALPTAKALLIGAPGVTGAILGKIGIETSRKLHDDLPQDKSIKDEVTDDFNYTGNIPAFALTLYATTHFAESLFRQRGNLRNIEYSQWALIVSLLLLSALGLGYAIFRISDQRGVLWTGGALNTSNVLLYSSGNLVTHFARPKQSHTGETALLLGESEEQDHHPAENATPLPTDEETEGSSVTPSLSLNA